MQRKFSQYLSRHVTKEILEKAIIILDTNILIDLYRYSSKNRIELLKLLEKFKKQLFLPYTVGEEFFKNRIEVIDQVIKQNKKIEEILDKCFKEIFKIESDVIKEKREAKCKELNELKEQILNLFKIEHEEKMTEKYIMNSKEDKILEKILELFKNKVSEKFSEERIAEIKKEGDKRYQNQIPPGYKDKKKPGEDRYGDLLIWKEMIEISKKEGKNIVFISNDKKEDWIKSYNNMPLSPKIELIEEFRKETENREFYIMSNKKFLKLYEKDLNLNIQELNSQIDKIENEKNKEKLDLIDDRKVELNDKKIYLDLKEKFYTTGLIDKLENFIFGQPFDINYFDLPDGTDSSEYINYMLRNPFYVFKDEELEKLKNKFLNNYENAMCLLGTNYFPTHQEGGTILETTYKHKTREKVEEFMNYKADAVWSLKTLLREGYLKGY